MKLPWKPLAVILITLALGVSRSSRQAELDAPDGTLASTAVPIEPVETSYRLSVDSKLCRGLTHALNERAGSQLGGSLSMVRAGWTGAPMTAMVGFGGMICECVGDHTYGHELRQELIWLCIRYDRYGRECDFSDVCGISCRF